MTSGHIPHDARSGLAEDPAVGLMDGTVPAESQDRSSGRHSSLSSDVADMIVSRLFEVGLVLQFADVGVDRPTRLRLQKAAEEVDALIRDVRSAIFGPAS